MSTEEFDTFRHNQYVRQKRVLVDYMQVKIEQEDWHGVADAAMDIREMEAKYKRGNNV
jgi:hypothetical protein